MSVPQIPCLTKARRSPHRGQTLIEVLVAIALLSVLFVFISGDLTNVLQMDRATDRSLETSAAGFLLGVMKQDQDFWNDPWSAGPTNACLAPLGGFTDPGPSPSPDWHAMPTAPPGCPAMPFSDDGGPQPAPSGGGIAPPVGDKVEYMWNASPHGTDPWAADLTVWVRREGSPAMEFHSIRYEYPGSATPTPIPTGPTPTPPPSSPPPTPTPGPTQSPQPTPSPSPTGIGV